MKPLTPSLSLLFLACAASGSSWAACSHTVVDAGLVTTVTVTSGANEYCDWSDNNPNSSSRTLSVAGVVVPALGQPVDVAFYSQSIAQSGSDRELNAAACHANGLTCAGLDTGAFSQSPQTPLSRLCAANNESAALSATATCVFQRLSP